MKVGFILECQPTGADAFIYPYLALKFCPKLKIEKPQTLTNKKNLINEGPSVAQILLDSGCDYVFVIWDRMPKWGGTGKCKDHVASLEEGLNKIGVDKSKVVLCCISDMLESWMIVHGQAVTDYFSRFSPKQLPYFGDNKDAASQANPKDRISKYNGKYNDTTDNFKIVQLMNDFDMPARWNESFAFFKKSVELICSNQYS